MSNEGILIVEDDEIIAADLQSILTKLGYKVLGKVTSGEEALQKVSEMPPDLILMDIYLIGKLNGIETAIQIHTGFDIPILYLTAYSGDELLKQAKITKPYCCLIKPVQDRDLHACIEMALYRHKLEATLKENKRWLDTMLKSIRDAVITTDEKGCITFMNNIAEGLTGWKLSQVLGHDLKEVLIISPEKADKPPFSPVEEVILSGSIVSRTIQTVLTKKKGKVITIENNSAPIRDDKGNMSGVVFIFRDITERKKSEDALRASEERYRIVVDNINFGVMLIGADMEILSINKQMRTWYPSLESKAHPLCSLGQKNGVIVCKKCLVCETFKDGQVHEGTVDLIREEKLMHFRILISPVKDDQGKVIAAVKLLEDITERKQMEEERKRLMEKLGERVKELQCLHSLSKLLEQHDISLDELFRKVIELVPTAFQYHEHICARIIFEGKEFKNKNFNQTEHKISTEIKVNNNKVGFLECFYLGKPHNADESIFLKEGKELLEVISERLGDEVEYKLAVKALKEAKDELEIRVRERTSELRTANEELRLEIAERKKVEDEREKFRSHLFHSQKMEAIGRLAGGVAHDFNNMLTVIKGRTEILLRKVDESDPIYKSLKDIKFATSRSTDLTRQLLLFSRKGEMESAPFDLNNAVINLSKMLSRIIGEDIDIIMDLEPDLWTVIGDERNIEQVIMNLLVNARDAMPEGGKLTIKTQNVTVDENYCYAVPEARSGKFIYLSITDTGIGMDKELGQRIFEPFFTTKEAGKSTGIGLPAVYGIVKQHEGWITLESEPMHGSTFKIFLPASSLNQKEKIKEGYYAQEPMGKGERILLVEDEERVRAFVMDALKMNGYVVFGAENAQMAKEIFEKEKGNFHLVFSDIVLPDTRGDKLVEELMLLNPKLRVLLGSGYIGQKVQWKFIKEKGIPFIQKPYSLNKLFKVVKDALNS